MISDANILTFIYFLFFISFFFVHLSIIFWLILKNKIFFRDILAECHLLKLEENQKKNSTHDKRMQVSVCF